MSPEKKTNTKILPILTLFSQRKKKIKIKKKEISSLRCMCWDETDKTNYKKY